MSHSHVPNHEIFMTLRDRYLLSSLDRLGNRFREVQGPIQGQVVDLDQKSGPFQASVSLILSGYVSVLKWQKVFLTIFFSDTKGKVRKVNVLYCLLVFSTFPCPLLFSEVGSLDLYFLESFASRVQLQIAQMKGIHRRFGRGREAEVITLLDLTYHHTLIFSSLALLTFLLFSNTPSTLHSQGMRT